MTPITDDQIPEPDDDFDNDFSELDELLAEATAETEQDKQLKTARKRLARVLKSTHPASETEKDELVALIRSLEENRVWSTVGTVALFHTQTCEACGSKHSFFLGWMTEQTHVTDPTSRRLIAGRPIESMPERREDHDQGVCECCANCVECVIAINQAVNSSDS